MILMNHLNYKCKSVSAVVNVIQDGTCSDGMSGTKKHYSSSETSHNEVA